MPKEDFLKVLDSVAASTDPHQVFVIITGGEPLMREDLEECGKAIYDKDFADRRSSDVRCTADPYRRSGRPE